MKTKSSSQEENSNNKISVVHQTTTSYNENIKPHQSTSSEFTKLFPTLDQQQHSSSSSKSKSSLLNINQHFQPQHHHHLANSVLVLPHREWQPNSNTNNSLVNSASSPGSLSIGGDQQFRLNSNNDNHSSFINQDFSQQPQSNYTDSLNNNDNNMSENYINHRHIIMPNGSYSNNNSARNSNSSNEDNNNNQTTNEHQRVCIFFICLYAFICLWLHGMCHKFVFNYNKIFIEKFVLFIGASFWMFLFRFLHLSFPLLVFCLFTNCSFCKFAFSIILYIMNIYLSS